MSHLLVLGHPKPNSLNGAIALRYLETVRSNGQDVVLRDLYAINFDPLLKESERTAPTAKAIPTDTKAELVFLEKCDVIAFVYPLWFGMPPAIIKGYIDRVFGAAFRSGDPDRPGEGSLRGKRLVVISTSASGLPWLESHGMWISLRQSFDEYLKTVFGFSRCDHYHADSIVDGLSPVDAERVLREIGDFAEKVCAELSA